KLVVPYPLSFYYGYDAFPLVGVFSVRAALALAAYGTLALYVIRKWRTGSAAAFGIAWYLVAIAPYSNLFLLAKGIVAERSAYVASTGFALAAAFALFRFVGVDAQSVRAFTGRRALVASVAAIAFAYAALTVNRNRAWADSFTLYETDLPHLERSVMAHEIYARQLRREFAPAPA